MARLELSLNPIVPEIDGLLAVQLEIAGRQAVQELQRRNSLWPVDSGRSKRGFYAEVRGGEVVIINRTSYSSYVEAGIPAGRTRNSARDTLTRPAARKRIVQAAQRGRVSVERAQDPERERERRLRDERVILEGGPDSQLSREGRKSEARRRFRNRRSRRRYRRARALNNQPVKPWVRLSGAEIRVASRLANYISGDLVLTPAEALIQFGGASDLLGVDIALALEGNLAVRTAARRIRRRRQRARPLSPEMIRAAGQIAGL